MTEEGNLASALRQILERRLDAYLADLRRMTSIDCGTGQKAGIDLVANLAAERMREAGGAVELIEHPLAGNDVVGRFRGKGSSRILLLCHSDTVYPPGTAAQRPFRIEEGRIFAPGVADMKSGLLSAIYAVSALLESGFDNFAEVIVECNSDEEGPPRHSIPTIEDLARRVDVVLCMEAARANGDMVSARKGVAGYSIHAAGRESHAGVAPNIGRNAIVALCDRIVEIWGLNGMLEGLTVNPGVITGGTVANTVPGEASCQVDLRVSRAIDVERFDEALQRLLATSIIPDVQFQADKHLGMPPMEKTSLSARLVELAQQAALESGFSVNDTTTGGGSDGAYAAAVGTPVLDGLGPIGGAAHSEGEYVLIESILPRTAMVARLMTLL